MRGKDFGNHFGSQILETNGYKVICADVTKVPIAEKFDVIIAGEVLEHLGATGMFMKNCAIMLNFGAGPAIRVPNLWCANVYGKKTFRFFYLRG